MNDPLEMVESLAVRARQAPPPQGHVVAYTMEQLRQAQIDSAQNMWRGLALCACGLALIAALGLRSDYRSKAHDPMQAYILSCKLPGRYL